jgi:two-component system, NtrC family, sensor histidine kinase KinB
MTTPALDQIDMILACINGEITIEDAAARLGVSIEEIRQREAALLQAGKNATGKSSGGDIEGVRDRLSAINALNAISQSLSAILDLHELLETIVDNLLWVFGYKATACLVEGDDVVIKSGYALNGTKINWYDWHLPINTERNPLAWVATHARPLNIVDTANDKRYVYQEVVGHVRSELTIPMMFKGNVLGVLDVKSDVPHAFDQNDMSVLETVCFQLAVALENATLFRTVRTRAAQAELIQRITAKAMENLDVQGILTAAVQMTREIMGYSGVAIGLIGGNQQMLNLVTQSGNALSSEVMSVPIDDTTVIGSAARLGQTVLANEVTRDERFSLNPLRESTQSELVVPMRSRNALIGVINVESDEPNAFTETDVATISLLADQLIVAIRSAELREGIEQANARFLAVLEATDDGIIVWDEAWRILFANPAASRMLGMPAEQLIGISREDVGAPRELLMIASAHEEEERIEFSGSERQIGMSRNLLWESENATGFLSVIHDITSQVVLEETRADMTSMLVHDLRGPLTSVVSGIEMAKLSIEEDNDPPKAAHYLRISERSGGTLLNLINSLLDITKLEAGAFALDLMPIKAELLFEDVMGILEGSAKNAKLNFSTDVDLDVPSVMGDSALIRRALQNLVDNAIKFTPDGGSVDLSAHRINDHALRFEVADTGPGVPEAYRKKIFEKYSQVPNQRGRRRGTGLGLALCKLVAEAHRGKLWVEPRPTGGSVFILTIGNANEAASTTH